MTPDPQRERAHGLALTTADALARGITRREIDSDAYVRARHGVHVPQGAPLTDPDVRIAVAAAALRGRAALGGWAAARLHERTALRSDGDRSPLVVFDGLHRWPLATRELDPLLICAPRSARIAEPPASRVFRSDFDEEEIELVDGVRVTRGLRTAFDIARLGRFESGVVAIDRLRSLGVIDGEDLEELIAQRRGWVGADLARRVLRDSSDRVESPRESLLRLVWLGTGLGRPLANPVIRTRAGEFLARVDLLDPATGIIGEYDGEHHASAQRRSDDARRQEALHTVGLRMIRATSVDLATSSARLAWQGRLRQMYASVRRERRSQGWVAGY